ncbi:hypothetical protein N7454_001683 [Penicillium verhagenii]|nr:hypothetical protein N7454_001683 [Penicillium verhagenii]
MSLLESPRSTVHGTPPVMFNANLNLPSSPMFTSDHQSQGLRVQGKTTRGLKSIDKVALATMKPVALALKRTPVPIVLYGGKATG